MVGSGKHSDSSLGHARWPERMVGQAGSVVRKRFTQKGQVGRERVQLARWALAKPAGAALPSRGAAVNRARQCGVAMSRRFCCWSDAKVALLWGPPCSTAAPGQPVHAT